MHGRPGFAAGRAGDFIIAGVSQADVTEIIDVVDGTADSLADSAEAQQVAAELPARRCRSPTSTVRRSWMPWARRRCKAAGDDVAGGSGGVADAFRDGRSARSSLDSASTR